MYLIMYINKLRMKYYDDIFVKKLFIVMEVKKNKNKKFKFGKLY